MRNRGDKAGIVTPASKRSTHSMKPAAPVPNFS